MSVCVPHPNLGCLIQNCVLFCQNASRVYTSGPGPWEVSPGSSRTLRIMAPRVGVMQLCKLRKHALELEWSGGRRGRAEAEGLRGGKRWAEKGKGGHTMTSPPSYATMSQSGIASP